MKPTSLPVLLLLLGGLTPGCVVGSEAPAATDEPPLGPDQQRVTDEAVGVSIVLPASWRTAKDPVLFGTHGFLIRADDAPHDHASARVALAYESKPSDLEALVADKLEEYASSGAERVDLTLPDGRRAVAVTNLPGTDPYTAVFTTDGDRVYEIGLWSETPGVIDVRGTELLAGLRFRSPTVDVRELGLRNHAETIYGVPPPEVAEINALALQRRGMMARAAAAEDPELRHAMVNELVDPPVPAGTTAAAGCGFTAPDSLYWQLQWDDSNTFYSGTYYDLRERSGWSAMSGNFGSWWGTNYHVGLCYEGRLNQYYANDWPAQHWANAYAAFSGYVEWAGWGTDGFATLGRYVVVRNGNYRSLTAHLTAIRDGVEWGAWIDGYWDTIGWAGDTGGPWDPHLHARVAWGESLTWNGQ
ncbi:MAG: M23 family metallopeptidase, partial [Deltaproteobacteria bacterium]|nr:M23 family metallopeptidase [Deltaproteobacteria bacterium]